MPKIFSIITLIGIVAFSTRPVMAVCAPDVLPRLGILDCDFDGDCTDQWGECVQNNFFAQDTYECRAQETCWRMELTTPKINGSVSAGINARIPNEGTGNFLGGVSHSSESITVPGSSSDDVLVFTDTGDTALPDPTVVCNVLDATASTNTNTVHHIESIFDGQVRVRVKNDDSGSEQSTVYCIAIQDDYDANVSTTSTSTVTTTSTTTTTEATTTSTSSTVVTTTSTSSTSTTTTTTSSTSTTVAGGPSTMFAWVGVDAWPTNTGGAVPVQSTAQRMRCFDVIQGVGIDDATRWVIEVTTALDTTSSITIYSMAGSCPESGSCQVATTGAQNWSGAGVKTVTTSAFDLTAGEAYRICWCATSSTGGAFRGVTDLGTQKVEDFYNSGARHIGVAPVANNCSSGVAPSNTGTLEDTTAFRAHPIIFLHTEP